MIRKIIAIVAAAVLVTAVQTARAAISLADLVANNGSLTIDDKVFSGFGYIPTGLSGFDASQVLVTASIGPGGVDYLTFTGPIGIAGYVAQTTYADLALTYTVTSLGNPISMIDQLYTGGAQNGSVVVSETATSSGAPTVHSTLTLIDVSDPNVYPNGPIDAFDIAEGDLLTVVPPQNVLHVTKDIAFAIYAPGGMASVSVVQQSFHQVPEATTVIAGALLLLPFGISTLRILRKTRLA